MQTRRMRLLREKHGISVRELGRHCGISYQRLFQIELGEGSVTVHMKQHIEKAFSGLIASRQQELSALELDFEKYRSNLLDFVEE